MSSAASDKIVVSSKTYRSVREGLATVLAPYRESNGVSDKQAKNNDEGEQAVFYNPIQQFNRDLSILAILIYGEGALVGTRARFDRKREHYKKKRKQQRPSAQPRTHDAPQTESNGLESRKRKSDDLEPDEEDLDIKKGRVDDFDADEEELELLELYGGALVAEQQAIDDLKISESKDPKVQATSNGHADNEVPKKQRQLPFTILDALSATGLRALRYAKEIPFTTKVIANDLSPEAVKSIELNIDHNDVRGTVHSNVGDARAYMYSKIGNEVTHPPKGYIHRFDVIDLDPYGTAAPFLDAAIQALKDGGLLCVTCTDAGVFASNGYPEKAFALYNGIPIKGPHSHEGGIRLILNAVATVGARYGLAIEPLLCLSIDFYARLFIRVHKRPHDVKMLAGTTMIVYSCDHGCGAWTTQLAARNSLKENKNGVPNFKHGYSQAPSSKSFCDHCGSKMHLSGPMWAGPLHNPYFVQRILDRLPSLDRSTYATVDRIRGMLTVALEEDLTLQTSNNPSSDSKTPAEPDPNQNDENTKVIPRLDPSTIDATPFFFMPTFLSKVLHCATPPEDAIRGAIRHLGYRVTRSHCKAGSFKTNAPWNVIWEIMLEWIRQKAPIKPGAVKANTPGWRIISGMRGTQRKHVVNLTSELVTKLEDKRCDNANDLKTLLQSILWRLEHERFELEDKEEVNEEDADVKMAEAAKGEHLNSNLEETEEEIVKSIEEKGRRRKIVFDEQLGKEKPRDKLVRYQINPRANWGPMNRANAGV